MSIIIIGVGSANFDAMEILDGDGKLLKDSRGQPAARDIVQFVPFRKFVQQGPTELAAEVLRELPKQVTEFFSRVGKLPNPPIQVNANQYMQI
jgi:Copine